MHRNVVILHISDLHFGRSVKPHRFWQSSIDNDAKEALEQAITTVQPRPDFIVVTGDLADSGRKSEMTDAQQFLERMLDRLWEHGHVARCIVIPGNHDVWNTTWMRPGGYLCRPARLRRWDSVFPTWSFLSRHATMDAATHLTPFVLVEFYADGKQDGAALDAARKRAGRALRYCEYYPAFRVAFLKLDSNIRRRRYLPGHIARGMVGLEQRRIVDSVLQDYVRATEGADPSFADARLIALVHHHLTRLPNVRLENWMLMDDAGEVARWLGRHGVRLVLHGHYHQADLVGVTYWDAGRENRKVQIEVVSAGSATAKDVGDGHNSYNHIELGDFQTFVRRPLLDHGEAQALEAAHLFSLRHRPTLTVQDPIPFISVLEDSLSLAERYADREHAYESITSIGYIDQGRTYWATITLEGVNVTAQATRWVPYAFTAVGAQHFKDTDFHATDLLTGANLPPPQLSDQDSPNVFPCRVFFNTPVQPQQRFRIQLSYVLRAVMLEEQRDYDMLHLLRFPRGIQSLIFGLVADRKIVAPSLWEIRGQRLIRSGLPLEEVTVKGRSGYQVQARETLALSYVLLYEKLVA